MKNNRLLGMMDESPVYVSEKARNRHVAVLGGSGSGKTSEITMLAVEAAKNGELVVEINMRNCLNRNCLMENVKVGYEKVARCVNVLDGLPMPLFEPKNHETNIMVVHRVTSLLAQSGGLTPTQTTYLKDAVSTVHKSNMYKTKGIRAIQEYLECQEERTAKNVAGKLRSLLDNNLIVDGKDVFEDSTGILEIDVNGLEYDDQMIFVKFILDYLLRMAETGVFLEKNLTIVVDECQNFDYKPGTTMYTLLNEGRRLGISLILAATELNTNKATSVLEQCGTVLYFQPSATSRKKIAKKIAPQDVQRWVFQLSTLEIGEFVAVGKFVDELGDESSRPCVLKSIVPAESAMQTEKIPLEDKVG